jgi:molybdopterin-guanine dinucleotide biosynthesis protein A
MKHSMKAGLLDNRTDVVVLGGGLNTIPLYEGYEPGYKALIPYEGRASIHYVLDALSAVDAIGRICIEGPRALLKPELATRRPDSRLSLVEGGATFLESLLIGLEHFRDSRAVLFVTADLPLLTPEAVQDFLAGCADATTDYEQNLYVAAVPEESYMGDYTRATKPFNRYRDISACHGNLFLANPDLLENQDLRRRVERLYGGRKNGLSRLAVGLPLALTFLIGVDLFHFLTLRQMADYASRHLGIGIIPVLVNHPEITMDVDEPDDYQFVMGQIEKRTERLVACG